MEEQKDSETKKPIQTTSSMDVLSEDPTITGSEKVDQVVVTVSGGLGLEDPQRPEGKVAQISNIGSEIVPGTMGPSSLDMQEEDVEVSDEKIPGDSNQSSVEIDGQTLSEVVVMDADTCDHSGAGTQVGDTCPEVATDEGTLNGEGLQATRDSDVRSKVLMEECIQFSDIHSKPVMDEGTCDQGGKDAQVSCIQPDGMPLNSDHSLPSSATPEENADLKIPEELNQSEVAVEENTQPEETWDQGGEDPQVSDLLHEGASGIMDIDLSSTAMPEGNMEGTSQGSQDQGGKDHQAVELDPESTSINRDHGLSSILPAENNDGSSEKIGETRQCVVAVDEQIQGIGTVLPSSSPPVTDLSSVLDVVGGSGAPETAKGSESEVVGDHVDHSQVSDIVPENASIDPIPVSSSSPVKEGKKIEARPDTDPENASINSVPQSSSSLVKEDGNIEVQADTGPENASTDSVPPSFSPVKEHETVVLLDPVECSEAKLEEKPEGSLAE